MADPKPGAEAPKKTQEEIDAEAAAKKAKDGLMLFKVVTDRKISTASPDQLFELNPGANHFEGPLPKAVADRWLSLQKAGIVTVETLDGDGKAKPWPAPEPTK